MTIETTLRDMTREIMALRTKVRHLETMENTRAMTVVYTPWTRVFSSPVTPADAFPFGHSIIPLDTDRTLTVERCTLKILQTTAGSTSNYYRVWFDNNSETFPSRYGVSLTTIAANTWTDYSSAPTNSIWSGIHSQIQVSKIGSPTGNLYILGSIRFHLT